jgi:hypothetical protein
MVVGRYLLGGLYFDQTNGYAEEGLLRITIGFRASDSIDESRNGEY